MVGVTHHQAVLADGLVIADGALPQLAMVTQVTLLASTGVHHRHHHQQVMVAVAGVVHGLPRHQMIINRQVISLLILVAVPPTQVVSIGRPPAALSSSHGNNNGFNWGGAAGNVSSRTSSNGSSWGTWSAIGAATANNGVKESGPLFASIDSDPYGLAMLGSACVTPIVPSEPKPATNGVATPLSLTPVATGKGKENDAAASPVKGACENAEDKDITSLSVSLSRTPISRGSGAVSYTAPSRSKSSGSASLVSPSSIHEHVRGAVQFQSSLLAGSSSSSSSHAALITRTGSATPFRFAEPPTVSLGRH